MFTKSLHGIGLVTNWEAGGLIDMLASLVCGMAHAPNFTQYVHEKVRISQVGGRRAVQCGRVEEYNNGESNTICYSFFQ